MLLVLVASTQTTQANDSAHSLLHTSAVELQAGATPTPTPTQTAEDVPTVTVPQTSPAQVPTVTIPQPRRQVRHPQHKPGKARQSPVRRVQTHVSGNWIWAYLTSYCPGSAGWLSSSGQTVFYGMLANDFYPFGTHVWMPVIGITGVVEDRIGDFGMWNHFDVWSPVCYGTPTGWFRVAIEN